MGQQHSACRRRIDDALDQPGAHIGELSSSVNAVDDQLVSLVHDRKEHGLPCSPVQPVHDRGADLDQLLLEAPVLRQQIDKRPQAIALLAGDARDEARVAQCGNDMRACALVEIRRPGDFLQRHVLAVSGNHHENIGCALDGLHHTLLPLFPRDQARPIIPGRNMVICGMNVSASSVITSSR